MLGLPAQLLFNGPVVRYQAGGVPCSPAGFLDLKVLAADLAHHLEYFAHASHDHSRNSGMTAVVGSCASDGAREILHMDIVPDTGAVFGVVIGTKN